MTLYPTIEVAPTTPATDAYLTHNPIPVQFTAEDFDQVVDGGNFVTKVIYLPDPKYQELAVAGVETLVSTRLEPGVDPILEADKRGTILLIVRLGAIDLEMPNAAVGAMAPAAGVSGAVIGQPSERTDPAAVPSRPGPGRAGMAPRRPGDATVPRRRLPPGVTPAPAPAPAAPARRRRAPGPVDTEPARGRSPRSRPAVPAPRRPRPRMPLPRPQRSPKP